MSDRRMRSASPGGGVSFGGPIGGGHPEDDEGSAAGGGMGYQQTLMYGRYSKSLGDYAKEEAKRQRITEKIRFFKIIKILAL